MQIAKAMGGRVLGTAGSEEKRRRLMAMGANAAFDYRRDDLVEATRSVAPAGVEIFWETQREPAFDRAVAMLADEGRMVLMAGRDSRPAFPVGPFYVKGCRLVGFAMFKADWRRQAAAALDINRWLQSGELRVPIDRVMRLEEAAEAHALQESATLGRSGTLAGKIVIEP